MDKDIKLHGIRARGKDIDQLAEKYRKLFERYSAFAEAYELMGNVLHDGIPMSHVDEIIIQSSTDLEEADLNELRKLREFILNDMDIAVKEVLGGKKIDERPS